MDNADKKTKIYLQIPVNPKRVSQYGVRCWDHVAGGFGKLLEGLSLAIGIVGCVGFYSLTIVLLYLGVISEEVIPFRITAFILGVIMIYISYMTTQIAAERAFGVEIKIGFKNDDIGGNR